jgi:hypothetical protein
MSISIGDKGIVKDSLVFYLDSANRKNYLLNEVEVLVVAGGGGGGANHAGGGGAGGLLYNSAYPVTPGSAILVTVGNGGSKSTNYLSTAAGDGQNSVFGNITTIGGGGGGNRRDAGTAGLEFGRPGGSGGGGGGYGTDITPTNTGGTGRIGQGNAGGTGAYHAGAGGGGAGGTGETPSGSIGNQSSTCFPGNGGQGLIFNISGFPKYYAGGGGGGGFISGPYAGKGGVGGGGDGQIDGNQRVAGEANTGGGGGGANGGGNANGGDGGSGVVIVRYPGPRKATGGTITQVNGYTIHLFTSSGTFTPFSAIPTNGSTSYGMQDFSGYNNSVYAVNGTTYNSEGGGVIVFDGVDDYLETGNIVNGVGLKNQLTIESWTKVESSATPSSWVWVTPHMTTNGNWVTGLLWNGSTVNFRSHIRTSSGTYGSDTPVTFSLASMKNWNHFVQVYNGSQTLIYINGSLFHTFNIGSGVIVPVDNIVIGAWKDPNLRIVNAQRIAYATVYNKDLTSSEVSQNFNALRGRFGI